MTPIFMFLLSPSQRSKTTLENILKPGMMVHIYMSVIPALERMKEDHKFKVSLGYSVKPCLQKNKP
jgi:hypothetical protein